MLKSRGLRDHLWDLPAQKRHCLRRRGGCAQALAHGVDALPLHSPVRMLDVVRWDLAFVLNKHEAVGADYRIDEAVGEKNAKAD